MHMIGHQAVTPNLSLGLSGCLPQQIPHKARNRRPQRMFERGDYHVVSHDVDSRELQYEVSEPC